MTVQLKFVDAAPRQGLSQWLDAARPKRVFAPPWVCRPDPLLRAAPPPHAMLLQTATTQRIGRALRDGKLEMGKVL